MNRIRVENGVEIPLTTEEETARDAEEKEYSDAAPAREMVAIRQHRNHFLSETDWMANSDVTMSDDWKTYRQALRDIPSNYTVYDDVVWPTKP